MLHIIVYGKQYNYFIFIPFKFQPKIYSESAPIKINM